MNKGLMGIQTPAKSSKSHKKKVKKQQFSSSKRSITTVKRCSIDGISANNSSLAQFMSGNIAMTKRNLVGLQLLTIAHQGMKYVAYNDGVSIKDMPTKPKTTTTPISTPKPPPPPPPHSSSVHPTKQTQEKFSFSNVNINTTSAQSHQQQPQRPLSNVADFEAYPTPSQKHQQHQQQRPSQQSPKMIDGNPLYAPLDVPIHNMQVRNSPLIRHLDISKLLFQTTNFLFIGPRDAHVESIAYLYAQQHETIQVKHLNHKTLSSTLEDIVVNGKEMILWSDIPDIVSSTELQSILPSPNFVTIYLDFPPNKVKFAASNQTRDALIQSELVDTGLLDSNHLLSSRYKQRRPDGSSPITSDSSLEHKTLWQFDSAFDYRILLSETMTPNEIFDRIQARLATSDAYITTRSEFTSESNALTHQRIQDKREAEMNGQFEVEDQILGGTEHVGTASVRSGGLRRVGDSGQKQRDAEKQAKLKARYNELRATRKILRYLPDGRVLYDDGEVSFPGQDDLQGDDKDHGLFELNSFLNTIVNPLAGQGGLFLPDMPSPYLLNSHHMFDVDEDGKPSRYNEDLAQEVIKKGQSSLQDLEEDLVTLKSQKNKPRARDLEVVTDPYTDNNDDEEGDDPDFSGTVNQMHCLPQSLRRMCELNYLQRLQRLLEGFPFAGIRPEHVSEGLVQHFFDFNNDNIITTSSFHHLKPRIGKNHHGMVDAQGHLDLCAPLPKVDMNSHPNKLPPFNPRPTSFVELYHSEQGIYDDIKTKVASSLITAAEQFETTMKEKSLQQQRTVYFFQHGKDPLDEATELIYPPSLYDRFAMISSGTPEFTLASLRQQNTITPHLILLPIRQKSILFPSNDSTKSTTHLHRSLLSTAWSPLQYLQFHTNLQLKDSRVVPIGSTYYESRSLQELSHIKLKRQFQLQLEESLPSISSNPATLLRPGENDHLRLINLGTMNSDSFSTMIPDISVFLHGYLELVNQNTLLIPTDRSSGELSDQIKTTMGLNAMHGGLNKNDDGDLINLHRYTSRLAPRIYSQYAPQRLSQWDHQIIAPIKSNLSPSEINASNIASYFKPSVCDVVVPVTNLNMLPAAVMARDLGTPIRQFIIAVDDKYRWLVPLLSKGLIPGVDKKKKNDIWHLRRDDITALERFFYLICSRDSDLVPVIIQALEAHYTASLYVHDPNRTNSEHYRKKNLKKEAQMALGSDAIVGSTKSIRNRYDKKTALVDGDDEKNTQEGDSTYSSSKEDSAATNISPHKNNQNRQAVSQYMKKHFGSTPSQGVVIDVGDNLHLNSNADDDQLGDGATINEKKRAFFQNQLKVVQNRPLLNPVKTSSTPEFVEKEYQEALLSNPNVIFPDAAASQAVEEANSPTTKSSLQPHQIKPTKKRRIDADDDSDNDISSDDESQDFEDPQQVSSSEQDIDNSTLETVSVSEQENNKMTEDMIVELMLEDPDVEPAVKRVIEKMVRQMNNQQELTPTNRELRLFQDAFLQKQKSYKEMIKSMPQENTYTKSTTKKTLSNGEQETQDMVLQRLHAQVENHNENDDQYDGEDSEEFDPELKAKIDEEQEWEDKMFHETYDFELPQEIIRILQEEFIVTHVPKKFLHQTIQESLSQNGRLLDKSSALALAATTLNPLVHENSMINLDSFFDEILEHCKDLRGDADSNPNRHLDQLKRDENTPAALQLAHLEQTMTTLNKRLSVNPQDADAMQHGQEVIKQIEILQQSSLLLQNGSTDDALLSEKRTKYPKVPIPLIIPQLAHPFNDYELLLDSLNIPTEQPSLKLNNKDLSLHVLKQLQSIYAHAVKVSKENGFELDSTNTANITNKTKDLILPPPHQGTLQMLAAVQQQQYAEKPVRIPFVEPNQTLNKFTQFDYVLNDQLMKFMKSQQPSSNVPSTTDQVQ